MSLKFNTDRPKVSDEEIKKQQNFKALVNSFKQQSLKKAQGDEIWWKDKKVRYSTVIAGITVICTITYFAVFNKQTTQKTKNENITTQGTQVTKLKVKTGSSFLQAPSPKLKSRASTYTVNNSRGAKVTHPTSTKLTIPKNSFVDKNGKNVIGDVTIEYQEFHDVGDVVAAGIPLAYDSAGKKYSLETAGMFNISGHQNGEPVFIAPQKDLKVELASSSSEDRFNQYYLDTIERNWKYLRHDKPFPLPTTAVSKNTSQKKIELLENEIKRVIPKKIDSVNKVLSASLAHLPKSNPPIKPLKATAGKPTFVLDGSYEEYPELAAFDKVVFEVGAENRNYSKDLHDITWTDIKVSQGPKKGINYLLTLSYRNRIEKLIVYPVLSGEEYERALTFYSSKFEKYEALVEKRKVDEKRLMDEMAAKQTAYLEEQKRKQDELEKEKARQASFKDALAVNELNSNFNSMSAQVKAQRIFSISRFGIYNSDHPHAIPKGKSVIPVFVNIENNKPLSADYIYLVDHSRKTVYYLDRKEKYKMAYDPNSNYSICLVKNNTFFVCSRKLFGESAEADQSTFRLLEMKSAGDNLVDFKKALEI